MTAVADGDYPYVFNNDTVDGSFGVTSKITLERDDAVGLPREHHRGAEQHASPGSPPRSDQMVTSFSSKSELALNLSTDGKYVTFMGYNAAVDTRRRLERQHARRYRPDQSADVGPYYRVVGELGQDGTFHFTETNAFSGDNGRAAILNDESGAGLFYAAGNAGNGANPEPTRRRDRRRRPAHPALDLRRSRRRPRVSPPRWAASTSTSWATRWTSRPRTTTTAA